MVIANTGSRKGTASCIDLVYRAPVSCAWGRQMVSGQEQNVLAKVQNMDCLIQTPDVEMMIIKRSS